jgi:hypothetical protein
MVIWYGGGRPSIYVCMREYGPMHVVQIIGVYHWLRKLRMHLSSDFRQRGKGDIKLYMPLHPEMHTVKSMSILKQRDGTKYM